MARIATQADYDAALKKLKKNNSSAVRLATKEDLDAALNKLQQSNKNLSVTDILLSLTGASSLSEQEKVRDKMSAAVAHGISQTAAGAHSLYEKLRGNDDKVDQITNEMQQKDSDFENKYGNDAATKAGMFIGQSIPYMAGGEALGATEILELLARPGTKLAESMGFTNLAPKLGALPVTASGAAIAGASAYTPNENQGTNAAVSTGATLLLPPALKYTYKGIKAIIPDWSYLKQIGAYFPKMAAKILGKASPISAEDLQQAITDNQESNNPPLSGGILQIPYLQKLEVNTLPNSPFSGQSQRLDKLATDLVNQATDLHSMLTNDNERIDNLDYIDNALSDAGYKENKQSKQLYNISNKLSDENRVTIPLDNLFNKARQRLMRHSRTEQLSGISGAGDIAMLKNISAKGDAYNAIKKANEEYEQRAVEGQNNLENAKTLFDDLDKAKQYVSEFQYMKDLYTGVKSNPIEANKLAPTADKATLQDATFIKSLLKNMENSANAQVDRENASIYNELYKSVDNAIKNELDKPENLGVKKAYELANANYAANVVPLLDKKINAVRQGKFDMDTFMSTFLPYGSRGKTRTNILNKIMKIAPETKESILTEALRPAIQTDTFGKYYISAGSLAKQLKDIGEERLQTLIDNDPNKAKAIKDFQTKMAQNGESLGRMANQKTGYQQLHNSAANEAANAGADVLTGDLSKVAKFIVKLGIGKGTTSLLSNPNFLKNILQEKLNPSTTKDLDSTQIQNNILKLIAPILTELNNSGN